MPATSIIALVGGVACDLGLAMLVCIVEFTERSTVNHCRDSSDDLASTFDFTMTIPATDRVRLGIFRPGTVALNRIRKEQVCTA